jgi:hypothetical protein
MRIDDTKLEKLGRYFCHWNISTRYGISFERFVQMVILDTWSEVVA